MAKHLQSSSPSRLVQVAAIALASSFAHAAPVFWDTPTTIAGDADVLTAGGFTYGYTLSGTTTPVNGVTFTGSSSTTSLEGNVSLSGLGGYTSNAYVGTTTPWTALSTAYKTVLQGGVYAGATAATVTLNNLTSGHVFAAQIWVNDSRTNSGDRTETVTSTGGNTVTLDYNTTNLNGGLGQFSVGRFAANATTQAFTLQGNASTQLNAIQLRNVTNIGNWVGSGGATWDAATTSNFAGNLYSDALATTTFATAKAPLNSVTFADSYWNSGSATTVTQTAVTVAAGGVSTGRVYFDNNAVNYTFSSADASGIAGTTAVVKTGTGTVTFSGANTYSGSTTISAGTLEVSSLGALGSGNVANNGTLNLTAGPVSYTGLSNTGAGALSGGGVVNISNLGTGTDSTLLNGNYSSFTGTWNIGVSASASAGKVQMNGADNAAATVNVLTNATLYSNTTHNAPVTLGGGNTGESLGQLRLDNGGNWTGKVTLAGTINGAGDGFIGSHTNNTGTISGIIDETGGSRNLSKVGSGTIVLSNANTYTGGTTIGSGTLRIASTGSITHTAQPLSLGSSTRLDIASGGSASFSVMTSGNSSQVNIAGNWTGNAAQASQHNTLAGNYTQTSGTGTLLGVVTGNAPGDVTSFCLGGSSILGVGKGQFASLQVGGRGTANFAVSGSAALTVTGDANPAANNSNQLVVGNTSPFTGPTAGTRRMIQQGGTVTANGLQLGGGQATATDGIYYLNGGTLTTSTLTRGSNVASTGTLYFGGGTFKSGTPFSTDANVATTINSGGATIDTTGGNLTWSGAIAAGHTGTVTGFSGLTGGSGYTPGQLALTFSAPVSGTTATGYAVVNQSGTVTDIIITNPGSGYTSAPTISGFTGGTGASANAEITTTAGGLTKTGAGTLTLSNANTYTGTTAVNGGTLALSGSGSIDSSTGLAITAGASFNTSALAGYSLAGAQPLTLTIDGTGSGSAGSIVAAGLNISAAVVTFDVTAPLDDAAYVIATYTSKTGATFASVTPPAGYTIDYAFNGGTQIALVPAPPAGYTTWIAGFTVGDATAGGDPENDGMKNVLEYVLNGNPGVSDPSILPTLDASGANFIFTFSRRYESKDDTTQVFRYGTDLTGWTDVAITGTPGPEVTLGTPSGGSPNLQSVTITIPKDANTSMFGLLKVTRP